MPCSSIGMGTSRRSSMRAARSGAGIGDLLDGDGPRRGGGESNEDRVLGPPMSSAGDRDRMPARARRPACAPAVCDAPACRREAHREVKCSASTCEATRPISALSIGAVRNGRRQVDAQIDSPRLDGARLIDEHAAPLLGARQPTPLQHLVGARDGAQADAEALRQIAMCG